MVCSFAFHFIRCHIHVGILSFDRFFFLSAEICYGFANRQKNQTFAFPLKSSAIEILRFLMNELFLWHFSSLLFFAVDYTWAVWRCPKGNSRWRDNCCYGQKYHSDMLSRSSSASFSSHINDFSSHFHLFLFSILS